MPKCARSGAWRMAADVLSIGPGRQDGTEAKASTVTISADSALVLFSGGQDSTVCLAWALERFARVETVGFDYSQRHAVELSVRGRLRDKWGGLEPDWDERLCEGYVIER